MAKRVDAWEKAKSTFVAVVTKGDPGKDGKKEIDSALGKKDTPIVNLLKDCDEKDASITSKMSDPQWDTDKIGKELAEFEKSQKAFHKDAESLTQDLAKLIEGNKLPGVDPEVKKTLGRGLKVLKTQLDDLDKSNDEWFDDKIRVLKAKTNQVNAVEDEVGKYTKSMRAALARGSSAVQRIKAKPTSDTYNKEFPKAAKDIADQIKNFSDLAKKGVGEVPGPKDPTSLSNDLKPFAEGNLKKIDELTVEKKVLDNVKQFSKAVKEIEKAYKF